MTAGDGTQAGREAECLLRSVFLQLGLFDLDSRAAVIEDRPFHLNLVSFRFT